MEEVFEQINNKLVICKYCEKEYPEEQTYNFKSENEDYGIMCIDCLYETYIDYEV